MLLRGLSHVSAALLLACLSTTTFAVSLIDALIANGADQFALALESDPALLAFFLSPSVQTVFAPIDGYKSNNSGVLRRFAGLPSIYQACSYPENLALAPLSRKRSAQLIGDKSVQTNLGDAKLAPNNQSVVAEYVVSTNSTTGRLLRRWGVPLAPPSSLPCSTSTKPLPPPRTTSPCSSSSPPPPPPTTSPCSTSLPPPPPPPPLTTSPWSSPSSPSPHSPPHQYQNPPSPPPPPTTAHYSASPPSSHPSLPPPPPPSFPPTTTSLYYSSAPAAPPPQQPPHSTTTSYPFVLSSSPHPPPPPPPATFPSSSSSPTTSPPPPPPPPPSKAPPPPSSLPITSHYSPPPSLSPPTSSLSTITPPTPPQTQSQAPTGVIPNPPIQLASGFGNRVNLLKADIPYDGGILQITDGYFTIPETVSLTLAYTNLTGFLGLITDTNLSAIIDNTHRITIFVPSNAAIASVRSSYSTPAQIQNFVYSHIVPNFLGYLPQLTNGLALTTLANTTVTITIQDNVYFVNGAKILDPDVLTDNGAILAIDQVLSATPGSILSTSNGNYSPPKKSLSLLSILGLVGFVTWMC